MGEEDSAEELSSFLLPMLAWEPSKRQSASEALKHPWLYKVDEEVEEETDEEDEEDDDEENGEEVDSDEEPAEEPAPAPQRWTPKLVQPPDDILQPAKIEEDVEKEADVPTLKNSEMTTEAAEEPPERPKK